MLKISMVIVNIFLTLIICLKIPKESMGLTSLSPSLQGFLNKLIAVVIFIYFAIALRLNLPTN